MVTLFTPEESIYDLYSACVAATEPLRERRDEILLTHQNPITKILNRSFFYSGSKKKQLAAAGSLCRNGGKGQDDWVKRECATHMLQSTKVVKALGLSVPQFNILSKKIAAKPELRKRVLEQAYLYRIAATIAMDKVPLIEDPVSAKLLKAHKRRRLQMFAKSLTEIEELRGESLEQLRKGLNLEAIPVAFRICNPSILPLLSPKIQNECNSFPNAAENIVKKYGLNSIEFN
jgi:hypothetical protein